MVQVRLGPFGFRQATRFKRILLVELERELFAPTPTPPGTVSPLSVSTAATPHTPSTPTSVPSIPTTPTPNVVAVEDGLDAVDEEDPFEEKEFGEVKEKLLRTSSS
jgi:hypothetical protein